MKLLCRNLIQNKIMLSPTHTIILFELDFNIKFPLLCLLHFLSDLKSNKANPIQKSENPSLSKSVNVIIFRSISHIRNIPLI